MVRYRYSAGKFAETVWEVKDAIRAIRRKHADAHLIVHMQGTWAGQPMLEVTPDLDVPVEREVLEQLLASPPYYRVIVVPVDYLADSE